MKKIFSLGILLFLLVSLIPLSNTATADPDNPPTPDAIMYMTADVHIEYGAGQETIWNETVWDINNVTADLGFSQLNVSWIVGDLGSDASDWTAFHTE